MAVVESICSDHLAGRFAKAIAGEAAHPVGDPSRIPHALAQWEIQAHRTLATHPVPANIVLVARTQGLPTARVVRRLGRQTLGPNP